MTEEETFEIMEGMEEVNREMVEKLEAMAPTCHFRKMAYECADSDGMGGTVNWWECLVCGHTKEI